VHAAAHLFVMTRLIMRPAISMPLARACSLADIEKDFIVDLIRRYAALYFVEILGVAIMGNHFHILARGKLGDIL